MYYGSNKKRVLARHPSDSVGHTREPGSQAIRNRLETGLTLSQPPILRNLGRHAAGYGVYSRASLIQARSGSA